LWVQGMGGLMSLTGEADGEPMKTGVAVSDLFTGMYASTAILAALAHRDRSGQGQHIDLALLDVTAAMLANQASNVLAGGVIPKRNGNAHPSIVPYQVFASADGHVILAVGNDKQFSAFCAAAGCPALAADRRFKTNADRVANRNALIPMLRPVLAARNTAEWVELLDAAGVPGGPINTLDAVFNDPQIRHRGMVVELPHAKTGTVKMVANPIKFSATPITYERAPPELGQDDC
jgi:crotonobetainyl-CoA:carnitine CoA-transferase CaiB-like acyl-CoA transferase